MERQQTQSERVVLDAPKRIQTNTVRKPNNNHHNHASSSPGLNNEWIRNIQYNTPFPSRILNMGPNKKGSKQSLTQE